MMEVPTIYPTVSTTFYSYLCHWVVTGNQVIINTPNAIATVTYVWKMTTAVLVVARLGTLVGELNNGLNALTVKQ